jgi:hypothetical protein
MRTGITSKYVLYPCKKKKLHFGWWGAGVMLILWTPKGVYNYYVIVHDGLYEDRGRISEPHSQALFSSTFSHEKADATARGAPA